MPIYRSYYPVQSVALGAYCANSGTLIHGLQSVTMNTSFNLEQVFEIGQIEIYENIEGLPDIEVTLEKVLDGYPMIYHLGTRGATSSALNNRTNQRADLIMNIFSDALNSASGQIETQVYCSGLYVNSLNYTLPVDGNCTESVTFVGNDKIWRTSSGFSFVGNFNNNDTPPAGSGVQRRENVIMGAAPTGSIWPSDIPNMTVVNGSGYNTLSGSDLAVHIQDVSISTNLNREDLFELGRKKPYYRYATFPVAVDCSINTVLAGSEPYDGINANSDIDNLTNQPIQIKLQDATVFNLGTNNKLLSTSFSTSTDGGVSIITYNYQNFNSLSISNRNTDPEGILS